MNIELSVEFLRKGHFYMGKDISFFFFNEDLESDAYVLID